MNVAIYGVGEQFNNISKLKLQAGVNVVGVFDSDASKWGLKTTFHTSTGKVICFVENPQKLFERDFDMIIITPVKAGGEIEKYLVDQGIEKDRLCRLELDISDKEGEDISDVFLTNFTSKHNDKRIGLLDRFLLKIYKRMLLADYICNEKKKQGACKCSSSAKLYDEARIINPLGCDAITIGNNSHVRGELNVWKSGKIEIGDCCYIGAGTYIWSCAKIHIGSNVLIGHNCNIFDNDTHPKDSEARHEQFMNIVSAGQPDDVDLNEKEIWISDNVWIGTECIIMKGVHIGENSIIGAATVVNRDVPANTVVHGNASMIFKEIM